MGYHTSNAAYAYDMQVQPEIERHANPERRLDAHARPRFDVYTGEGREANQAVSPLFTHAIRIFCVLAVLFCIVGVCRVALASMTAAHLNESARTSEDLEKARNRSASLEVMRSVYGADTRIRDLATGSLGMVPCTETVDLDLGTAAGAGSSTGTAR